MFGKLLKKAKGFGHAKQEDAVEDQAPSVEEKPAEAIGSKTEDCPVCKAGEACVHNDPLDDKVEDNESREPGIIDIPPDDRDNKILVRNGYDRIRETAPRKFVIQMSFPAPTIENPKRMARKTAELYGFSSLHAINMIGWKPKKCVVVNEGPRVASDASKPADGAPEQKPAEGQAVGEVAVLVNGVPKGSLSAPSDMRWKNVIAEAKKLPDVAKALEGHEVIDSIGSSEGPKRTLRLVSRELPKKQEKVDKPEGKASEEAKPEGAAPVVLAEPTVPETPAEAEAEAPKAAEAAAEPVKTTRKDRRAPKRAAAEAAKIAKAEADAAAAKAEEEAKAKAAEEAAAKAKEEAEAKAKEEAVKAKAEAEAAEAADKAVADANPPEQPVPVAAPVAVPVAEPVYEVAVDLAAPDTTDKSAAQVVPAEGVAGVVGDGQ